MITKQRLGIDALLFATMLVCLAPAYAAPAAIPKADKPLTVYILAGQSNMQGKSQVSTIPRMALSPETKSLHDAMLDEKGEPKDIGNVSIVYFTGGRNVPDSMRYGTLKAGRFKSIGPEMGFGITMGKQLGEPILIIKVAWGGKSLKKNYRPPSAERLPIKMPKKSKSWSKDELETYKSEQLAKQGEYYRRMMKHIKTVLSDPGKFCPAYNPEQGYRVAGFSWFQGFNDIGGEAYYGGLLGTFIRDVRKDLNSPTLPFSIGVIGIGGEKNLKLAEFRKAMASTAEIPEFKGNVVAVETLGFWDNEMVEAIQKIKLGDATVTPRDHELSKGKSDQGYHYLGSAYTYSLIGEALAKAIIGLNQTEKN